MQRFLAIDVIHVFLCIIFAAGCNYGSDPNCRFPCHCGGNCDPTLGCNVEDTCDSLDYDENLDDEDGRTFSGPQCQIGEFKQLTLVAKCRYNYIASIVTNR